MMSAELPENALPPPAVALVVTVGAAVVVVVGIETEGCGKLGDSGFVGDCAAATAGSASDPPTRTSNRPRSAALNLPPR